LPEKITEKEHDDLMALEGFPDWDYVLPDETRPFEYKQSDWGWVDGQLVAVDYSSPVLFEPVSL
jgi:hypothetical protein